MEPRQPLLPWLTWRFSLVFMVAIVLLIGTLVVQYINRNETLEIVVTDQTTGMGLEGAFVSIGDSTYEANEDGSIRIDRPGGDVSIRVSKPGYQSVSGPFGKDNASTQSVPLQPDNAGGSSRGMARQLASKGASSPTLFEGLATTADGTGGEHSIHGRVLDDAGTPVQGAIVRSSEAFSISTGDGTFRLDGGGETASTDVSANGFAHRNVEFRNGVFAEVKLEPIVIKAIYADMDLLMNDQGIQHQIDIANRTEINAIVVDIKQTTIYYDSKVQFFRDAGTVQPVVDISELLEKFQANDIYVIARMVVFQDPLVAGARPDLAVLDSTTGDLWRNDIGFAWVSAFNEELWDANIALAEEATTLGFDEIQYDYVRFPSDGDLSTAEFGRDYTAEARESAITGFMKQSYQAIHDKGGKLAADLFGFVTIVDDEQYIGQRFTALEPYLDVVCMMIYPSHFEEGNIASAPGHPNDYPYETILESLQRAEQNVPGSSAKFRPWLQDFTYYGMREYTANDVRLQIDAAEDFGTAGWMLWGDPLHVSVDALKPED